MSTITRKLRALRKLPDRGVIKEDALLEALEELDESVKNVYSFYVDSSRPDDDGAGLSWATSKKTLAAAFALVPPMGWTYIYVKGNHTISSTQDTAPYSGYIGHLRIIAADNWTTVASGSVTLYQASAGRFESDLYTLDLGAYVKADSTDRALWLEVIDDAGATHIRKVMQYDYGASGKYDVERPGTLAISPGQTCKLVKPSQTITLVRQIRVPDGSRHTSVWFFGFKIVGDTNLISPTVAVGFAACELDHSAAANNCGGINPNGGMGTLLSFMNPENQSHQFMFVSALIGTYFEGKQGTGTFTWFAGCYAKLKNSSSAFLGLLGSEPYNYSMINTVFENARIWAWGSNGYSMIYRTRGVGQYAGVEIVEGTEVYMEAVRCDGVLKVDMDGKAIHYDVTFASAAIYAGLCSGYNGSDLTVERAAASNEVGLYGGPLSRIEQMKLKGGYAVASGASPLVQIEGRTDALSLQLTACDRGAGPLVLVDEGAVAEFGATCSGDNSNAGGHGLQIRRKAYADVPNGVALTGNGGGTTTVYLGKKALTAYPAAGAVLNDLPAGSTVGDEELAFVRRRS